MSDHRGEQLVTYVAGPFSVLVGILVVGGIISDLITTCQTHRPLGAAMMVIGLLSASALVAYGTYIIRQGHRRLREGPWRAEHYES
ncbi:MAG: hypothetical protein Q7R80_01410 [bacterium]|nr:hypothetical protein [bacterium]